MLLEHSLNGDPTESRSLQLQYTFSRFVEFYEFSKHRKAFRLSAAGKAVCLLGPKNFSLRSKLSELLECRYYIEISIQELGRLLAILYP